MVTESKAREGPAPSETNQMAEADPLWGFDERTGRDEPFPNVRCPRSGPLGYFGTSQFDAYMRCPWAYAEEYERGRIPETRSGRMVRGSVLHRAMAAVIGPKVHISRSVVDEMWTEEVGSGTTISWGKDDPDTLLGEAWLIFQGWQRAMHSAMADGLVVLGTEIPFYTICGGYLVKSALDGIYLIDGKLAIPDLKSDKQKPSDGYLARNFQFSLYCYAAWTGALEPLIPAGTIPELYWYQLYYHLPYKRKTNGKEKGEERGDPWIRVHRDEADMERFAKDVKRLVKAIRFKCYYPRPQKMGGCDGCRFERDTCPKGTGYDETEMTLRLATEAEQKEAELEAVAMAAANGGEDHG